MDRQGQWAQLPKRFMKDAMVADVAMHVLARHAPDLLLVHFLSTDSFQHLDGPRSPEAYWAIEYVDDRIGRLLASLAGALDRDTVVFVVSDHGFLPSTESIRTQCPLDSRTCAQTVRDQAGHAGGRRTTTARHHRAISSSAASSAAPRRCPPLPGRSPRRPMSPTRNWISQAPPASASSGRARREAAHRPAEAWHRQHPEHVEQCRAPGDERGYRGRRLALITSRDIAPTLAHLLRVPMPDVEGRLLAEALD